MDVGSIRHWPRMTREQLVKVFPEGRTVHVPTDGSPLPGYQLALADVERGHRSVAPQKKRSLIARLFGTAQDQEETEDKAADRQAPAPRAATPAKPAPMVLAAATAPKPTPEAGTLKDAETAIPLPPIRPTFEIASAETRPAPLLAIPMDARAPNASDIINLRGYWQTMPETTAQSSVQVAQASPDNMSGVRRLIAPSKTNSSDAVPTGSIGPFTQPDRVPPEIALAYAAHAGSPSDAPRLASITSVPVAVPSRAALVTSNGAASVAIKPPETVAQGRSGRTESPNDRLNNPWLRGLVIVSSMHHAMTVTLFGEPDFRDLVQHMRKPESSVVMTFSRDPHLGMTSEGFTGSAVVFQATVTFEERRHAALR
jgi:hypothetical protein